MRNILKHVIVLLLPVLLLACSTPAMTASEKVTHALDNHGEVRPFLERQDDSERVDAAIIEAAQSDKKALIVMGANWCHDSRALATHFEKTEFQELIQSSFILEYVDVGRKNKNQDIARDFGLDGTPGTPTVLIIDGTGKLLNSEEAPKWRNAASRSEEEIYTYFQRYAAETITP
jgi:thioredoxin-related protein